MKLNIQRLYSVLFALLLLCQLYINSYKVTIVIQIIVLTLIVVTENRIYLNLLKSAIPIIILIFLPFVPTFFNYYKLEVVLKDFFMIIKPVVGISLGYYISNKLKTEKNFIKIIIYTGFISAIIHLVIVIITGGLITGNVSEIREYGKDNFLELFAIIFLFFYRKFFYDNLFAKKSNNFLFKLILFISCILYLSRTMLIIAGILLLTLYGFTRFTQKAIKILLLLLLLFSILYTFLFNINIDRNEKGLMGFLYKMKMAPGEIFVSKIDRQDHKKLWDHWRGYEANRAIELMKDNPSSFILGNGYGSQVNLKFKAPLTSDDKGLKYISEIHNGYVFIFYKFGIIGLILILSFLKRLYVHVYKNNHFNSLMISSIGLCYFFTTLTITGIYNKRDVIIFILGGFLSFSFQESKKEMRYEK